MPRRSRSKQQAMEDDGSLELAFASLAVHEGIPIRRNQSNEEPNLTALDTKQAASRNANHPVAPSRQRKAREKVGVHQAVRLDKPSQPPVKVSLPNRWYTQGFKPIIFVPAQEEALEVKFDQAPSSASSSTQSIDGENPYDAPSYFNQYAPYPKSPPPPVPAQSPQYTYYRRTENLGPAEPLPIAVYPEVPIPAQQTELDQLRDMIRGVPLSPYQNSHIGNIVAIDCEMVGVGPPLGYSTRNGKRVANRRSALARVSIVDFDGYVVLDAYVKPGEAVTDYRTAVSGIRPMDLVDAIPLANAKAMVHKILKDRTVVGHAVHNDLRILKCSHPPELVRDTQLCPQVKAKYGQFDIGLKALCQNEFGLNVQPGEHSSITDARAAMALYRLFSAAWEYDLRYPIVGRR